MHFIGAGARKGYSGVRETGENVPCLKHYFRCQETSGSTIYDSKGGLVLDVSLTNASLGGGTPAGSGVTTLAFNTDRRTIAPNDAITYRRFSAGAWEPVAAGSSVLNFMVARPTAAGLKGAIGVGVPPTYGITFSLAASGAGLSHMIVGNAGGHYTIEDGDGLSSSVNNGNVVAVEDCYAQQVWTPGGEFKLKVVNTAGATVGALTETAVSAVTGAITPNPWMSWNADQEVYCWMIFHFTGGIPADVDKACSWMAHYAILGERYVWPGWIGLT